MVAVATVVTIVSVALPFVLEGLGMATEAWDAMTVEEREELLLKMSKSKALWAGAAVSVLYLQPYIGVGMIALQSERVRTYIANMELSELGEIAGQGAEVAVDVAAAETGAGSFSDLAIQEGEKIFARSARKFGRIPPPAVMIPTHAGKGYSPDNLYVNCIEEAWTLATKNIRRAWLMEIPFDRDRPNLSVYNEYAESRYVPAPFNTLPLYLQDSLTDWFYTYRQGTINMEEEKKYADEVLRNERYDIEVDGEYY